MPKYVLDEKGILSIVDERKSGLVVLSKWIGQISLLILIVSITFTLFFLVSFKSSDIDNNDNYVYIVSKVEKGLENFKMLTKDGSLFLNVDCLKNKISGQYIVLSDSFEQVTTKSEDLFVVIREKIEGFLGQKEG